MTEEKPAREWWIQFTGNLQEETFVYKPGEVESDRHGLVPVIERSAYEKLERELASCEQHLKIAQGDACDKEVLARQNDELRRELAEARAQIGILNRGLTQNARALDFAREERDSAQAKLKTAQNALSRIDVDCESFARDDEREELIQRVWRIATNALEEMGNE